ncbi:hypothetical protein ACFP1Z_10820 [Streptomyces gamaensis]|uniref:IrrE N-terminal-like domain-containing protein n=1 Tax=Streptomyces gamaensis TaxID=1763542 RepID=A0ABW0Z200_9ACTN
MSRRSTSTKAVRRRCEKLIAALDLPRTDDIRVLTAHIADRLGHTVELVPHSLDPQALSGSCELRNGVHRITYQADTSTWHQEHIISHELGHLVSGHPCTDIGDEDTHRPPPATRVLGRDTVARMLARSHYDDPGEREAEIIGTLLQQHLTACAHHPDRSASVIAPALEHTWGSDV